MNKYGHVAKWEGEALQKPYRRFESVHDLDNSKVFDILEGMITIPKLIKARYSVDVQFARLADLLDRWKKDQESMGFKFELNPEFQRGHVWNRVQQVKFVEWMLRGGETGTTLIFNHPGWETSFEGDMVCVDGLQRITAVTAFLNNELPVFGYWRRDFMLRDLQDASWFKIQVGAFDYVTCLEWYLQMNSTGTPHTKGELDNVRYLLKRAKKRQEPKESKSIEEINRELYG